MILDHMSERKKARNILPCVAVHLGEAEGKSTLAKLFTPLDLEKTNELKISSHNLEIWWVPYATLKIFLNIV